MHNHSTDSETPELQILITAAEQGEIDPMKFCGSLEAAGVVGAAKLPYLLKAFKIRFEDAKEILINHHRGSTDEWADEMADVVDQLSQADIGLDDGHSAPLVSK